VQQNGPIRELASLRSLSANFWNLGFTAEDGEGLILNPFAGFDVSYEQQSHRMIQGFSVRVPVAMNKTWPISNFTPEECSDGI
jgi:hypothetical protein